MTRHKPALSPERQALAAAIERQAGMADEIAGLELAVDRAEAALRSAKDRRDLAIEAVEGADEAAADYAVSVAMGKRGKAPMTAAQASTKLAEAERDVTAKESAVATLRTRLRERSDFASLPRAAVKEAAAAVLRASPEAAALLSRVERLQTELRDAGLALLFLDDAKGLDLTPRDVSLTRRELPAAAHTIGRLDMPPAKWAGLPDAVPTADAWRAAMAALLTDAAAELPK